MPRFRKKPITIEAVQFTGDNASEIWDAFGADGIYGPTESNPDHLILTTTHGRPCALPRWRLGHPGLSARHVLSVQA